MRKTYERIEMLGCRLGLLLGIAAALLLHTNLASAQGAGEQGLRFNNSPIFMSAHGNAAAPPAKVTPSGITAAMREQGAYDPGDTLELLSAHRWTGQTNTAVFGLFDEGAYESVKVSFKLRAGVGGLGGAVALLPTEHYGDTGPVTDLPAGFKWDEPNLRPGNRGLAIAFDTFNPPTGNWFNAMGNLYNRPQQEVSVHFNGVELANVRSEVNYPAPLVPEGEAEGFVDVAVQVEYAIGGGYVTVMMNNLGEEAKAVVDRVFVPGLRPRESRLAFGASSSESHAGAFDIRAVQIQTGDKVPADREPINPELAVLADGVVLTGQNQSRTFDVVLPDREPGEVGRLLMNLALGGAPGGIDPWNCRGAIYVYGEDGVRYEVVRFITPFGREYAWTVDVTDYALLLRGKKRVTVWVESRGEGSTPEATPGWSVTADLRYFPGTPEREVVGIQNLWVGEPEYGNPESSIEAFFDPRTITLPDEATSAELKLTVTGHGTHPATYNAAEFMPADRTVIVNNQHRFGNLLWDTSAYLNPCRPQGGTWKFDRAGWMPGSVVDAWKINLAGLFDAQRNARLHYVPMSYENLNRDQAKATHWVETQVLFVK